MTDFTSLRSVVAGPVLERGDAGFTEELLGFNQFYELSPDAVVGATDAADIVATVRFALANALPIRVLATGHGTHEATGDGVVVTTRRMASVTVDPSTHIASIGAGAQWRSVVDAAAGFGLAPIAGSAPTVGVVGYLLGGGLGPLARSHGFSSDWVRGFTVVTGDAEVVEASPDENPDLYWALRGGKGGLGIVTGIRLELTPIPQLYAGNILYDTNAIEPALRAWVDFTDEAPDDVTTSVAIMRFPPLDVVPEPLRGKTMLSLRFAYPGPTEAGEQIIDPLRQVPSIVDSVRPLPLTEVATIHGDPTEPTKSWTQGALITDVDQDFATTLLSVAGPSVQLPLVGVEIRHIGSATHDDVPEGSAVGGRRSEFTIALIGVLMQPGLEEAVFDAAARLTNALAPWIADETNINFAGHPTSFEHFASAWNPQTFARLGDVRDRYDRAGIFAFGLGEQEFIHRRVKTPN
jgi:hypothetical protein